MLPIFELRGAIPLAVLHFDMPVLSAFLLSWVGNLIPILPIIYFLEPIRKALSHIKIVDKFFKWFYAMGSHRPFSFCRDSIARDRCVDWLSGGDSIRYQTPVCFSSDYLGGYHCRDSCIRFCLDLLA